MVNRPKTYAENKRDGTFRADRHDYPEPEYEFPPCPPRPVVHYEGDLPVDFDELIEANWGKSVEECLSDVPQDLSEEYAKLWAWDASDELALRNGCRFDLRRAMHYAYILRNNLLLWEGSWAGEPLILRTWQPETMLRIFGWVRPHKRLEWVRRTTKACIWLPKKHGKSPIGASTGVYLWRYDGVWLNGVWKKEAGQHVYSVAANGIQAGIVHRHAWNMVKHSPILQHDLERGIVKYNKATKVLTHVPSDSTYEILTGDGGKRTDSSEGLNSGGIVCDEAHVVDHRTIEVTTDAGASREQFLWFQASTFGKGLETYGKKCRDYGRDVASGKAEDDAFFHKEYGANEGISEKECGDKKVWIAANPNWDYTVVPLQMKQAYDRSRDDPVAFAGFQQRRLNLWQAASNPMLSAAAWAAGEDATLTLDSFAGCAGAAGLDLATSSDFAALAICYEDDETIRAWVRIWAAGGYLEQNAHRIPVTAFRDALTIHDGGQIRLAVVEQEIEAILRSCSIRVLGYDKMFAPQMAQNLADSTACGIYPFSQSLSSYAPGTARLKNAVRNGRFKHPGNKCLDWMAGHVQSIKRGDLEKPIKDSDAPWRKVDGIQATVMAVDCLQYVDVSGFSFSLG